MVSFICSEGDDNMKTPIEFFNEILTVPRGSGKEEKIAAYLVDFAESHGLACVRDEHNNVLIRKDGKGKTLVLQGHSDMVCEKNEWVDHDFDNDPIKTVLDGNILRAQGTTLGADDGISIAVMLSLLEDETVKLPLECLITSSEEIGLLGMGAFDFSLLSGRMMINMDSMDEGIATVSCCGGVRSDITLPATKLSGSYNGYILKVRGLYGGHSGEDINKNRANAIRSALAMIKDIAGLCISDIYGGSKDNAIPRECTVAFISNDASVSEKIRDEEEKIRRTLSDDDCNFSVSLETTELDSVFDRETTERIINTVSKLSLGVIEMDPDIEGLVKTSANLGIISTSESDVEITVSSRSSNDATLDSLQANISSVASENGGTAVHRGRYPGWDFDRNSYLRDLYLNTYEELFKKKAIYEGIHAGLECGLVKSAIPDMDIISIGANITSPHTPDETLDVESLDRLLVTVRQMIRRIEAE